MYAEDVDLCAAVRARGRFVLFSAEPEVVHLRGRSARLRPDARDAYRRSQIAFYCEAPPGLGARFFSRAYLKLLGPTARYVDQLADLDVGVDARSSEVT